MVVLYKLYVIYLQPMIRTTLENKDRAWMHILQISTVTLSLLHWVQSLHWGTDSSAECGDWRVLRVLQCCCKLQHSNSTDHRPAGRANDKVTHWHWIA